MVHKHLSQRLTWTSLCPSAAQQLPVEETWPNTGCLTSSYSVFTVALGSPGNYPEGSLKVVPSCAKDQISFWTISKHGLRQSGLLHSLGCGEGWNRAPGENKLPSLQPSQGDSHIMYLLQENILRMRCPKVEKSAQNSWWLHYNISIYHQDPPKYLLLPRHEHGRTWFA